MAYSELIKNFEKIRDYMREFYIYGFKSREDYTKKSARSYDDERRRIESWLGGYMAFRHTGEGKNVFISVDNRSVTFNPLHNAWKAKSFTDKDTFADRLRYIASFNEIANTNIEAVFDLILDAAVNNNVPQSELPAKLYIISDMEFDACVSGAKLTNFENAKRKFARHGYELPQLVFWNVASRNQQQPVTINDRGVALVSGCSPRIFSMAMEGELDPWRFMLSVIDAERYAPIAA